MFRSFVSLVFTMKFHCLHNAYIHSNKRRSCANFLQYQSAWLWSGNCLPHFCGAYELFCSLWVHQSEGRCPAHRSHCGGLLRWKPHLFPSQAVRSADLTNTVHFRSICRQSTRSMSSGTVNGSFTRSVKSAATRRSLSKPFSAATR